MTATQNIPGLEEHLQNLVKAQGSRSKVSLTEIADAPSLSAHINLVTDEIEYEIPTGWNPEQYDAIARFAKRLGIKDSVQKICDDVAFHEVGHRKLKNDSKGFGCPEDLQGKELAVDAVTTAMLEAGKFSQQGALYLENLISDVINNLNCSQYTHYNGLSMFFAEQGEINNGTYSPLYEAFVKLNMHLFGRKRQKKLVAQYFNNGKRVDEVVVGCIADCGLGSGLDKRDQNINILFDKSRWQEIYGNFARHLVKLMDSSVPEWLPGSGSNGKGYAVPAEFDGKEGKGDSSGSEKGNQRSQPAKGLFNPKDIDDPLLKRVLDKDNMKKIMQRRNNQGEELPSFVKSWQALDYLYQAQASELMIKAEMPRKGERMPIAPIQSRQFDPDKDDLDKILFGRILLDEQGQPCFAVPRSYVEHPVRYKASRTSYPDLTIAVLDCSVSMTEAANEKGIGKAHIIPWGDNSKYHHSVLTYYANEKALHRMGVGTSMRYNFITFGSQTQAVGERDYEGRVDHKKRMLDPVFHPDTRINTKIMARNTREPGSVLMTISDGEIWNWNDIKDDMKRIIADKFYVHFQIGSDTQATYDLESFGATVIRISDATQLPKRAIDITKRFYSSYAAGEV